MSGICLSAVLGPCITVRMKYRLWGLILLVGFHSVPGCFMTAHGATPISPVRRTWEAAGLTREALVFGPTDAKAQPRPLIIIFHGHGGSMRNAAQAFRLHELWPDAVVVYPQGLPTAGRLTDREGKQPGWQIEAGDHGDRDLLFFDAIVEQFKHEGQVFVAGHSNGGAFVYLLWASRGEQITAYASSAAAWFGPYSGLKPGKLLMLSGEKDDLVKYAWQRRTFDNLQHFFDCSAAKLNNGGCMVAESNSGAHIAAYVHPGGHQFPPAGPDLIVKFFKASLPP